RTRLVRAPHRPRRAPPLETCKRGGLAVKLFSRVARTGDKARPDSVRQPRRMPSIGRLAAAACLVAAGVIHVSQAPTHFGEWGPAGVTFLALAALEGAFAVLLLAGPAPVVVF